VIGLNEILSLFPGCQDGEYGNLAGQRNTERTFANSRVLKITLKYYLVEVDVYPPSIHNGGDEGSENTVSYSLPPQMYLHPFLCLLLAKFLLMPIL
jgi:hypothetical protein